MIVREANDLPLTTVIMPIRDEAAYIKQSLGAVLAQDYPPERIEILVVDGMSGDGTRAIVQQVIDELQELPEESGQSFSDRPMPALVLLDNPSRIVSTALNVGMRHAHGGVIIRVDGHCEIAPDYVRRCVDHLQNDGIDGVGGPLETVGKTALARIIGVAMSSNFGVGGSPFRTIQRRATQADTVPFPAYSRAAIERGGPFDEELVRNQDDEYNYRLRKLGAKILLAPDVRSRYYSRTSFRSLSHQYFQYGFWKVRVLQKHPRQMRPRQFVPVAFVTAALGSGALFWVLPASWILPLLVVGSYALANAAASIYTSARKGWQYLPLLPLVYAILHISYGLGFLAGLVRFAGRWRDKSRKPSEPQGAGS